MVGLRSLAETSNQPIGVLVRDSDCGQSVFDWPVQQGKTSKVYSILLNK